MMELLSVFGLCITATVLAVMLKNYRPEYAVAVAAISGVIIFITLITGALSEIFSFREIIVEAGIKSSYFSVALKALGICMVSGFISDICKDFGQTALANFALTAGRCAIFIMSVPLLSQLLGAAVGFIG